MSTLLILICRKLVCGLTGNAQIGIAYIIAGIFFIEIISLFMYVNLMRFLV